MSNYEKIRVGAQTDQGPIRPVNEDHFWITDEAQPNHLGALYIVADGVGGQEHGSAASQIATAVISKMFYEARLDGASIINSLADAILAANDAIFAESQKRGGGKMGSTLVTAVQHEGKLTVAHIGDARAYLVQGKKLRRLTKDDTWVQKQVDAGIISKEDAAKHELRNVVTQVLGNKPELNVHISPPIELGADGIFMLCSDGVYDVIAKEQLYRTIKDFDPQQAAESLVKQAINNGTKDNVTAIVVQAGKRVIDPDSTMKDPVLDVPAASTTAIPDATYHETATTVSIPSPIAAPGESEKSKKSGFPQWGIYLIVALVIFALLFVIGRLLLSNDNIGITFSSSEGSGDSQDNTEDSAVETEGPSDANTQNDAGSETPSGEETIEQVVVTPTPLPPTATSGAKPPSDAQPTLTPVPVGAEQTADPQASPTPQTHACLLNLAFVWTDQQINSDSCGQTSETPLPANSEVLILNTTPRTVRGPDLECGNNAMIRIQSIATPDVIGWVLDYTLQTIEPGESCPETE